jgi:hypothetical protein
MLSAFRMEIDWLAGWPTWQSFLYACWRPLGLFCVVAVLMMSLFGLLAVWAGLGRGHWFVRTAVVLGCISLLMTIPAFELVIVYLLQAGLTIVALAVWRNWRLARRAAAAAKEPTPNAGKRLAWQFSILDMLMLMAIVAWLSAMLTRVPGVVWTNWRQLLAEGVITAGLTIAAAWIGLSDGRWWLRLPLLLILFPAGLMSAWLWLWRRGIRSPVNLLWESCKISPLQAVLILVSLVTLVPVVGICWRLAHPRTFSEPPRSSTNGYDELVQAATLIRTVNVPMFETATHSQFKTFVKQCGPVYAPVRAALDKPCQVPLCLNNKGLANSIIGVQSLRTIARALYAQGRLAAMEGRSKDAVRSYTDTSRLGRAAMRDGLFIDLLVGVTIEGMGRDGIAKVRKSLSAEDCRALVPTLGDLIGQPALSADMRAREAAWEDNAYGWQGRLTAAIDELTRQYNPSRKAVEHACDRELAQSRLLLCELAIRAYSLQHGRNPATLADLVPGYLPIVPKDPFDGGDFVYRLTPTGYDLHSRQVGVQGKPISADDAG